MMSSGDLVFLRSAAWCAFLHCVVLFQALCLCVPTSFLKATAVPVAPLPFLPQRSERRLLFCCVPMSFRRRRTRRCCRPRCRASGRTTSGCRRSRRAQWLASSKSPSCCATSTSPVSFCARESHADQQKDANSTTRLYAQCAGFVRMYALPKADARARCSICVRPRSQPWILHLPFGEGVCKSTREEERNDISNIPWPS